ncbi:MAG: cytidine deaminase [Spirochaetaceae bacterium]|nr:cytidine deaminase [Spirochaetaceae bacterium]
MPICDAELIQWAVKAREKSYSPYSDFSVGAALLAKNGKLYLGCNIENAAFTPGICAERTAFSKALSEGDKDFEAIAIVGGKEGGNLDHICAPCGVCRQFIREFTEPATFRILLAPLNAPEKITSYTLEQLLPESFGPDNLK